ncbi:hypothetical protein FB45DRAFT_1006917 [Roridomyces roridus]|uniref:C3H1-type domain-containing protein n=1 Tax=Roridomyces roridus TaxID=1738132 RepID=A0AAD7BGT8_9AGAR|nr:hypothetical protein FB45DRAFT_1006917 [Roridomyces roridus]
MLLVFLVLTMSSPLMLALCSPHGSELTVLLRIRNGTQDTIHKQWYGGINLQGSNSPYAPSVHPEEKCKASTAKVQNRSIICTVTDGIPLQSAKMYDCVLISYIHSHSSLAFDPFFEDTHSSTFCGTIAPFRGPDGRFASRPSRSPSPAASLSVPSSVGSLSDLPDSFIHTPVDSMSDQGNSGTSTAPSIADLSTMDIAALVSAVVGAMQQAQPAPAAPAPQPSVSVAPPFTGSGATAQFAGKSLPAIFPTIDPKVILDIASHSFSPLDLPRLLSPLDARQEYVALPSSAPAVEHTLALKQFPSFHSLLRPLIKYFDVLTAFAASADKAWEVFAITHSASAYMSHLAELHQRYKWGAVIAYHVEFHRMRLWQMKDGDYSGWAQPDLDLLARVVFPYVLLPSSPPSSSSSSSSAGGSRKEKSKKTPTPIEQQICFDWNSGLCKTSPCPRKRRHVCKKCESSDHPESGCSAA